MLWCKNISMNYLVFLMISSQLYSLKMHNFEKSIWVRIISDNMAVNMKGENPLINLDFIAPNSLRKFIQIVLCTRLENDSKHDESEWLPPLGDTQLSATIYNSRIYVIHAWYTQFASVLSVFHSLMCQDVRRGFRQMDLYAIAILRWSECFVRYDLNN